MTDPFLDYLREQTPQRLSRFIVAYTEPVTRLVRRVVQCPEASRDVVQEVFLRLATPAVRAEDVPHPRAYVLRTALNAARNHLRSERARVHHEHEASRLRQREARSPEEEVTAREALERLYRDIDSLPEPLRVAIHLRAVDGLSYREIALVTGVSTGTVGSRMREARQALRRLLGGRQLAVAWVNLELAREQGWFPAATDGLSHAALARLRKATARSRPTITSASYAGAVVVALSLVSLSLLGLSTLFVFERPRDVSPSSEMAAGSPVSPDIPVTGAARPLATIERLRKPMAPVVVGAEAEIPEAAGVEPRSERSGESPDRESEGGETMNVPKTLLASAALAVGVAAAVGGVETGDFDGDGRLTIADVLHLEDGLEPAEGSLAGFEAAACYQWTSLWFDWVPASTVFLESLRRGIDGSLAHWDSVWPEDVAAEPLAQDARCEVELLPSTAPGGSNDRARLDFRLEVHAPVRSFSVLLEAPPGLLEAPPGGFGGIGPFFDETLWRRKYEVLGANWQMHDFGDLGVAVTTQAYLITGGRYVVTYDLLDNTVWDDIQPGEYVVTIEARLALGTSSGTYPIRVLPASEILFLDGTVRQPVVPGDGELTIENDVTEGLDDGIPPLELDPENRRILGDIEFRLVDGDGIPPEPGEPVVEALNDEEVRVRLQLRTEVPLNQIRYRLRWRTDDGLDLRCENPPTVVFSRPDGGEYRPWKWVGGGPGPNDSINRCGSVFGIGEAYALFRLAGADNTEHAQNRPDRPLEYFRPLGEWLDILELRLSVPDEAVGGTEIRLGFQTDFGSSREDFASFTPYGGLYPCQKYTSADDGAGAYWKYNVIFHDSFIRVRGDAEPPPPPDLGIRFALGTASGAPGELVEVPIQAASRFPLRRMRLALRLDPAILSVEELEVDFLDLRTNTIVQEGGGRPQIPGTIAVLSHRVCTDEDGDGVNEFCTSAVPASVWFHDTDPSFILLDINPGNPDSPFPGNVDGRLAEIGRFRLRIVEDARPGETLLAPAAVPSTEGGFEVLVESGGNALNELNGPAGAYSPANEVVAGTVIIESGARRGDLVRGDANADGRIDLSDAVATLDSLFTESGSILCEDAADTDDNGVLNITDPILLLGVLFGGAGALAPPSTCAPDPTDDALGCADGCRAR